MLVPYCDLLRRLGPAESGMLIVEAALIQGCTGFDFQIRPEPDPDLGQLVFRITEQYVAYFE